METKKTGPRDVFLHLLAIITLYFSVTTLGVLLFQYINLFLFDPLLDPPYRFEFERQAIRFAVAALSIVFPVYVGINWFLTKDLIRFPEKKELRSRKWFFNLTLFATTLVIIADLVSLIYNYLAGGLTLRFVLKILIVLLIASAVFIYYLWNLHQEKFVKWTKSMKFFVRGITILVVLIIVSGFIKAGSPQAARLFRFDLQRVNDLQNIQGQIVYFWQQKERLPKNLDELKDNISGYWPPADPENKKPYEYRVISKLEFELCAVFKTQDTNLEKSPTATSPVMPQPLPPSVIEEPGIYSPDTFNNWQHEIGRFCFSRKIDPELYKKITPIPPESYRD